jgi:hypothetical protein
MDLFLLDLEVVLNFNMKATLVLYTHTDVKDVWMPFFGQTEKWLSEYRKIIFVNADDETIPSDYIKIFYNDKKNYRERLLMCLEQINDELIIFHHEDMFLYNKPDTYKIELYSEYLAVSKYSFIKLLKSGENMGMSDSLYPELKLLNDQFGYIFSIQPTIFKRDKFIELIKYSEGKTIWEFESASQKTCRERNIYGYYIEDGGKKRGIHHYDSNIYPYIATAIVKGRWNTLEYPEELNKIFKKYNIDANKRGING